jgi:hypothetical protein
VNDYLLFAVLHYATHLVERYNHLVKYCQCEHNTDAREWQPFQSDGALSQNQNQLLSRHDDFSRMAEHLAASNVNLDRAFRDFEPGLQQRNSPSDDQYDTTLPT